MSTLSKERIDELLENEVKLNKMKATAERARLKRSARIKLLLTKAKEAGLSVSESEITAELKKSSKWVEWD